MALGLPFPAELSSAVRDARLLGKQRESHPERAPNENRGNSRASNHCLRDESLRPEGEGLTADAARRITEAFLNCNILKNGPADTEPLTHH